MNLHPAYAINGQPVLGTYGRTDPDALALVKEAGMNLVFGGDDLLDPDTAQGRFCLDSGIKVMYSLTGHVHGRPSLGDEIDSRQTEIPLVGREPLPPPGPVQIEDEVIRYQEAIASALLGCERGAEGTTPAPHRAGIILFWSAPVAEEVTRVHGSPNLYGYYVLDDTPGSALSALRGIRRAVRTVDLERPVCAGHSGATTLHNFAPDTADVIMLYHYPVLKAGYDRMMTPMDTQWMLTEARKRSPGVPFFGIYQAFWGGRWNKQEPLTPGELRSQMEDFVREGASGLIAFYIAPEGRELGGWNLDDAMRRAVCDANQEILSSGGLGVPPEWEESAKARIQPTGYWVHPREVAGIVPAWHVLAPFDAEGKKLDAAFPPEERIDLEAVYAGKGRKIHWITHPTTAGAIGLVELYGDVHLMERSLAYATCTVTSPRAQGVQMRFSSDEDAIVWFNGRQVWRHDGVRGVHWDADVVPVTLPAGETRILVKVYNELEQWGFFMRFTDVEGRPLEGLRFSPAPEAA